MEIEKIGKLPTDKDLEVYLKQGIIPVRFCYPGEGGNKWHKLRRHKSFKISKREFTAFADGLRRIKAIIGDAPINLIHLGPGDGVEIPYVFEQFKPNNNRKYAGVDISEQMINNTVSLNEGCFSNLNALWYLTDIEAEGNLELVCEDVRRQGASRNLLLLTNQGALLSNPTILQNLCKSMSYQDYLFIAVEGDDKRKRKEICSTYDLLLVRNLLSVGLRRAGYNRSGGGFRTVFNEEKSQAEVYFSPKGEKDILCLTSYKPKEHEFRERIKQAGLTVRFMRFYERAHAFAVLCAKERG